MVKELVEFMAKSLAEDPSQVRVKEIHSQHSTILKLRVARQDMGRVIGKEGRVANAMRILLRVAAMRQGKRAVLEIG